MRSIVERLQHICTTERRRGLSLKALQIVARRRRRIDARQPVSLLEQTPFLRRPSESRLAMFMRSSARLNFGADFAALGRLYSPAADAAAALKEVEAAVQRRKSILGALNGATSRFTFGIAWRHSSGARQNFFSMRAAKRIMPGEKLASRRNKLGLETLLRDRTNSRSDAQSPAAKAHARAKRWSRWRSCGLSKLDDLERALPGPGGRN